MQLIEYLSSWTVVENPGNTDNDIAQARRLPDVVDRKMAATIAPYVPVLRVNSALSPTTKSIFEESNMILGHLARLYILYQLSAPVTNTTTITTPLSFHHNVSRLEQHSVKKLR